MRRSIIKNFFVLFLIIFILGAIVYGAGLLDLKKSASQSAKEIKQNLKSAISSLTDFDTQGAKKSFNNIYSEINDLRTKTKNLSLNLFIKELPKAFNNLGGLSLTSIQLTSDLEELKNNGFNWILTQKGPKLISNLKNLETNTNKVSSLIDQIGQQAALINYPIGDDFTKITKELYRGNQILKTLISWLSADKPRHILILFQNHTEIRPGGGFLGSFTHVMMQRGSLVNLEVKDIYDVDGQLQKKIVPPLQLQTVTPTWGARDANWFFDFPTSAKKVSQLLEKSKFYQERETKFDGALAINSKIIMDILEITGPVDLPDYNLKIDSENFLPSIQREIEAGEDNKAGHPKKILTVLTPILFDKLGKLTEEQKIELIKKLAFRFENKDIMVYFDDLIMESYLKDLNVGGEIIELPKDFNGDYLAVVNANIGGGKTDALIKQKITLASDISLNGKIINNLAIERSHRGENENEWWYKAVNQNFIQILTPLGSSLSSLEGGEEKKITPMINYKNPSAPLRASQKYEYDSDLEAAELSNAFDRQNFSTWQKLKAGEIKTLTLNYGNLTSIDFKKPFKFIFEKQSGVDSVFEYSIAAPIGYKWKESGKSTFKYYAKNIPARLILELNLLK